MKQLVIVIYLSIFSSTNGIWPPEYQVELKDEQEFIISELLDRSDVQDVYDEEELIRQEDLKTLNLYKNLDSEKYFRIHDLAERKNFKTLEERGAYSKGSQNADLKQAFPEFNPDLEEPQPWIAGFVDKSSNGIIKDEDTIYFDDEARSNKTNSETLEKRSAENETVSKDYNYESLKAEYVDAVKKAESKNDTLKYKDVKEEETPQEVVETLIDIKPKNCSEEEQSGMGLKAVKCMLQKSGDKYLNKEKKFYMLKKVFLIVLLWIFVYLLVALPLWCQYGWCCCCFRCKFCRPRDVIEEIKTFYENNPPGVYHDEAGNFKKYTATTYEIYAQKNLEKAIQRL